MEHKNGIMRLEASNDPEADCWNSSSVLRTVRRGLLSASKYRMRWFLIMLSFSSIYIWNGGQVKKRAVAKSERQKLRLDDASSRFGNDIATHCVKAVDHLVECKCRRRYAFYDTYDRGKKMMILYLRM